MPNTYLGIDLAGPARMSGYAVLDAGAALLDGGLVGGDAAIFALAQRSGVRTIAIDCPLGLPAGLDCLDPAHACAPSSPKGIRESELAVRALGYGVYFTTKRTIIRAMAERGIALRGELEARGLRVIEVYPYATKCQLFGKRMPKKTTPEGVRWLRERLAPLVAGLTPSRARSATTNLTPWSRPTPRCCMRVARRSSWATQRRAPSSCLGI